MHFGSKSRCVYVCKSLLSMKPQNMRSASLLPVKLSIWPRLQTLPKKITRARCHFLIHVRLPTIEHPLYLKSEEFTFPKTNGWILKMMVWKRWLLLNLAILVCMLNFWGVHLQRQISTGRFHFTEEISHPFVIKQTPSAW